MKNVQMKKSIVYYVKSAKGKPKWTRLGHRDDPETWRKYAALTSEADQEKTFAAVAKKYLKWIQRPGAKPLADNTLRTYTNRLKDDGDIMLAFGRVEIGDIRPSDLAQYLDEHPHPSLANQDFTVISNVMRYAVRYQFIEMNPCYGIKRNEAPPRDVYITDDELTALWKALPLSGKLAVELLYVTGVRVRDVLKLKHSHVEGDMLVISEQKTKKVKCVPVSDDIEYVLQRSLTDIGPIITDDRYRALSIRRLEKLWVKARGDAGIKRNLQLRDIRAKHLTDLDRLGQTDQSLAKHSAGHAKQSTTNGYLRHVNGRIVQPLPLIVGIRRKQGREAMRGIENG